MFVGDFITRREKLIKAFHRGIITIDTYQCEMHTLFVEAQVSKGFCSDVHTAADLYDAYTKNVGEPCAV